MSTDPLGEAIGHSQPGQPPVNPGPEPATPSSTPPSQGAAGQSGASAGPSGYQAPSGGPADYQAPSAYEPQQPEAAWPEPEAERSLLERRPEIPVGIAFAGGFVIAQVLGRIRGR